MYDQITLKLNVDPFILGALKEDITSEDVSTNSVMPEACMGKVELICKQDGIICGLQVFKRVFELLDDTTVTELYCKDGDEVKAGQLMGVVTGDIRVLLSGERTALNYLQRMSGIASTHIRLQDFLQEARFSCLIPERQPRIIVFLKNMQFVSAVGIITDIIFRTESF